MFIDGLKNFDYVWFCIFPQLGTVSQSMAGEIADQQYKFERMKRKAQKLASTLELTRLNQMLTKYHAVTKQVQVNWRSVDGQVPVCRCLCCYVVCEIARWSCLCHLFGQLWISCPIILPYDSKKYSNQLFANQFMGEFSRSTMPADSKSMQYLLCISLHSRKLMLERNSIQ